MTPSHSQYNKQIDTILKRLDDGRPSDPLLQRIQEHVNKLSETYEYDESLGTQRFKLYVAQAVIDYYQGNEQSAKALMEEAVKVKGSSFSFAEEFLSHLRAAPTVASSVKSSRHRNKRLSLTMALVLGGVFMLTIAIGIISTVGRPSSAGTSSGSKAIYQASVDTSNFVVVNPATLSVGGTVKNTGQAAGDPTCTLNVSDSSDTYSGLDSFQLDSTLQPGQSMHWQDQNVTITKQGAAYVTTGTISCQ